MIRKVNFEVSVGVHEGSALSPLLFVLAMDTITRDIQSPASHTLLYADDPFLASHSKSDLEQLVQKWNDRLTQHGLRLNLNKTDFLTTDLHEAGNIIVTGCDLPKTEQFEYLLSANGELHYDIASRISLTWLNVSTNVPNLKFIAMSSVLSPFMVLSIGRL